MASRSDGVKLDDGRVVRWATPDWPDNDPRWDDKSTESMSYEELSDGVWVPVSEPVSDKEFNSKAPSVVPDEWEPWDE